MCVSHKKTIACIAHCFMLSNNHSISCSLIVSHIFIHGTAPSQQMPWDHTQDRCHILALWAVSGFPDSIGDLWSCDCNTSNLQYKVLRALLKQPFYFLIMNYRCWFRLYNIKKGLCSDRITEV